MSSRYDIACQDCNTSLGPRWPYHRDQATRLLDAAPVLAALASAEGQLQSELFGLQAPWFSISVSLDDCSGERIDLNFFVVHRGHRLALEHVV